MSNIQPTRADTFEVTVHVQNVLHPNKIMLNCGVWDKRSGGRKDSEELKYPPGGMRPEISLGGRSTTENVTVSRNYRLVRDHQDLSGILLAGVGKARMTVTQQPLDLDGNAFGRPSVWSGTLKSVSLPEHDSESNDAAMVELEMTADGGPIS